MDGREKQLQKLDYEAKYHESEYAREKAREAAYKIREQRKDDKINMYRREMVNAAKRGDQAEVANISLDMKKYEGQRMSTDEIDL